MAKTIATGFISDKVNGIKTKSSAYQLHFYMVQ